MSSPVSNSSSRGEKYKHLYKQKTPPWKDTYRRRCLERLHSQRQKLFSKFRNVNTDGEPSEELGASIISEVMEVEWDLLRSGRPAFSKGTDESDIQWENEDDQLFSVMEEIKKELQKEEQALLAEYQAKEEFERMEMEAMVQANTEQGLLCPICRRGYLSQNNNTIHCSCGVSMMVEPGVTLGHLQRHLESSITAHTQTGCMIQLGFFVCTEDTKSCILSSCPVCDFCDVVI